MGSMCNRQKLMTIILLNTFLGFETWRIGAFRLICGKNISNTPDHWCHRPEVCIC